MSFNQNDDKKARINNYKTTEIIANTKVGFTEIIAISKVTTEIIAITKVIKMTTRKQE